MSTGQVSLDHVRQLVHIQDERQLKIVPGLSQKHLQPAKFEKMRVGIACKVVHVIISLSVMSFL
jgi:hypothetical protein